MKFQAHTLVPFDRNLIDYNLLTKSQVNEPLIININIHQAIIS